MSNLNLSIIPLGTSPVMAETEKGISLMGSTAFLAAQHGLTVDDVKAHQNTMPLVLNKKSGEMGKPSLAKACKDLLLTTKKATVEQIAAAYKTYDTNRNVAYQGMRQQNAILASSPDVKVTLRAAKNKKTGGVVRIYATYAPAADGVSKAQRIKDLEDQVKRLTAKQVKSVTLEAEQFEKAIHSTPL